jgi:hypothetical protein
MPPKRKITKKDLMHAVQIMQHHRAPRVSSRSHAMLPRSGFSPFQHNMASKQHYGGLLGFGAGGLLLGGKKRAPVKRKTVGHAKNQARGAIVRQIMMQHGMTLPQASHYVKIHNIPY